MRGVNLLPTCSLAFSIHPNLVKSNQDGSSHSQPAPDMNKIPGCCKPLSCWGCLLHGFITADYLTVTHQSTLILSVFHGPGLSLLEAECRVTVSGNQWDGKVDQLALYLQP